MGRDWHSGNHTHHLKGFNPRARVGRDLIGNVTLRRMVVSIHAPAWGATTQ
ncbi:hypothetical protein DDI_1262 [Dickeya dianthicola RNS04.9]|nr:hypothetical protein DDI_1262 [Dickeya dianthicola RNS04.9]